MVDLLKDYHRIDELWRGCQEPYAPLSVAAALTFHETRRCSVRVLFDEDYANALAIAAAAISRIIPIYTVGSGNDRIVVLVDLARQKFREGATRVQCDDGAIIAPLAIMRGELLSAIPSIARVGVEYTSALYDHS